MLKSAMRNEVAERLLHDPALRTPAFVIDTAALRSDAQTVKEAAETAGATPLFALKSFSILEGIRIIAEKVEGFAASSLFEARLAREVLGPKQTVHVTTPGLLPDELNSLCDVADYVSFNSIPQWRRSTGLVAGRVHCGLRVNPDRSLVADPRYDPCRRHSKLGIPIQQLESVVERSLDAFAGISGLHFHTNCDSEDLAPLRDTVRDLAGAFRTLWPQINWVNLGGGYLFNDPAHPEALKDAVSTISALGVSRVFIEPGAGIARRAGSFLASVIDLFESGGKQIAVLDAGVNHMPEVFEYQFAPDVLGDSEDGRYDYLLAGPACLAGDIFGEYGFTEPLHVGDRLIFPNMGAYSMVKANMFNGINLPDIYVIDEPGTPRLVKRFTYQNFLEVCGVGNAADP